MFSTVQEDLKTLFLGVCCTKYTRFCLTHATLPVGSVAVDGLAQAICYWHRGVTSSAGTSFSQPPFPLFSSITYNSLAIT
jgi:hypothetical protein